MGFIYSVTWWCCGHVSVERNQVHQVGDKIQPVNEPPKFSPLVVDPACHGGVVQQAFPLGINLTASFKRRTEITAAPTNTSSHKFDHQATLSFFNWEI